MKWKFSLPESSVLTYYFVKLTGLAPFTVKNNRFYPPTLMGKLYPVFLAAGYVVYAIITVTIRFKTSDEKHQPLFHQIFKVIIHFMNLPSVLFTLVMFSLMHKKIVYLMNKLCIVSTEFQILGIEEGHGRVLKNLFVTTAWSNAVLVLTCVSLILMEPEWNIFYSMQFCIELWFNFNTVLIFTQILKLISQRFTLVNKKLYNLLPPAGHLTTYRYTRIFVENRLARGDIQPESKGLTDSQRIQKIESLHLEFCDLVDQTTHLFATPMLLNIIQLTFRLITFSCWLYIVLQGSIQFEIARILCTAIKMTIVIVQLFFIAHASATICQQGNATKIVLLRVWNKYEPQELTNEFSKFSNQLLHAPVHVSIFGFINLGYSFMFKIICTVLTYLLVFIQLGPADSDSRG